MVAKVQLDWCNRDGAMPVDNEDNLLEIDRFNAGLRQVLSVSKSDLNRMLAEEKSAKAGKAKPGPKPKSSASVHGSDGA
jgi:hypothetical protein